MRYVLSEVVKLKYRRMDSISYEGFLILTYLFYWPKINCAIRML